jgi:hypothetical protein
MKYNVKSAIKKKEIFYSEDFSHLGCYTVSIGESLETYCVHFLGVRIILDAQDDDAMVLQNIDICLPVKTE